VVGNHGKNPVVDQLTARLTARGKTVYRVSPYGKPPAEYKSLGWGKEGKNPHMREREEP
jgi:hypothetical protein